MNNFSNLGSFSYSVIDCKDIMLGDKTKNKDCVNSWKFNSSHNIDASYKRSPYGVMRLWVIIRGSGHVKSKYGDFDIQPNNAYFFPSYSILETDCPDYMEQIYIDFLQNPAEHEIEKIFNFNNCSTQFENIYFLVLRVLENYKKTDLVSQFIINSSISTILSYFIKSYNDINYGNLHQALQYINNNIEKKITLTYLANLANYSPEYFSSYFKKKMGVSLQEFIMHKRISKAKILLLKTQLSIKEISCECGFQDSSYFVNTFKKIVEVSPKTYRDQIKETTQ